VLRIRDALTFGTAECLYRGRIKNLCGVYVLLPYLRETEWRYDFTLKTAVFMEQVVYI
jgi:hypothetical protein